jgi:hypothetical protein
MLTQQQAYQTFHSLVASGCVRLCVHFQDKYDKKVVRRWVLNGDLDYRVLGAGKNPKERMVYIVVGKDLKHDIPTCWFFYASPETLGDFVPCIALAEVKYSYRTVPTRLSWKEKDG